MTEADPQGGRERPRFLLAAVVTAAAVAGFVLADVFLWTPWVGCTLSYLAPVLACIGFANALRQRRRARARGERGREYTATAALNLLLLPVAAAFALSCGTLNAIGSVAITGATASVSLATTAAPIVIDRAVPPEEFWGDERFGFPFGAFPNPVGIGPTEQEDPLRAAVRRTIVSVGFLASAYEALTGKDVGLSEPAEAAPVPPVDAPDPSVRGSAGATRPMPGDEGSAEAPA